MSKDPSKYPAKKGTPSVEVKELGWQAPHKPGVTAPQVGKKSALHKERIALREEPVATDCTEPRRMFCPNKCVDFCLKKSEAARAAQEAEDNEPRVFNAESVDTIVAAALRPRKAEPLLLPEDITNEAIRRLTGPTLRQEVEALREKLAPKTEPIEVPAFKDVIATPSPAEARRATAKAKRDATPKKSSDWATIPGKPNGPVAQFDSGLPASQALIDAQIERMVEEGRQTIVPTDKLNSIGFRRATSVLVEDPEQALREHQGLERTAVVEPVPEELQDTDAEYVPPFKSDAPLEAAMDAGWKDVLINNLNAEKDSPTCEELNPRARVELGLEEVAIFDGNKPGILINMKELMADIHAEMDSDTMMADPHGNALEGQLTVTTMPTAEGSVTLITDEIDMHATRPEMTQALEHADAVKCVQQGQRLNDIERDFFKSTRKEPETMNAPSPVIAADEDVVTITKTPTTTDAMAAHVQSIAAQDCRKMDIPADWSFHNKSIADNFDRHVREQLPWYDLATGIVSHLGRHYLPEGGLMYDIGASTGNVTLMLKNEIDKRGVTAVSLDNSEQMADVWRGVGTFQVADVRKFAYEEYDFAVCFLLLMFLPPADQRDFVQAMFKKLKPGGALVIFDKTDKFSGYLATVVHRLTMAGKVSTGVPSDEIVKKELSLAGVQRPIDVDKLLFHDIGACEVFRFGEFAGWVITK